MPYCSKCGAKLNEDEKFCHICGTPVPQVEKATASPAPSAQPPKTTATRRRSLLPLWAIILISVIAFAIFLSLILIALPVTPINTYQYEEVGFKPGIDTLKLNLTADVANIIITYERKPGRLLTLNTTMQGKSGIIVPQPTLQVNITNSTKENVLTVNGTVQTRELFRPLSLNITCDIRINPQLASNLNIMTNVGKITLKTEPNVEVSTLSLEVTTGTINATLTPNTVLQGDVMIRSVTGQVNLNWHNINVTRNVSVAVTTTTGSADVTLNQTKRLEGNMSIATTTTTGSINYDINIGNDNGAKIISSVVTGSINVKTQNRFTGTKTPIQSENYPATHNIDATLTTTTGSITINAAYVP